MRGSTVVIESLARGISDPLVRRRLEAAMSAAPDPPPDPPIRREHGGPAHEFYRPWYSRLLAKGCKRCGGEPQGWVQTQIETPYRFKRFVLWVVNLAPRLCSLISVVTSRRVSLVRYAERRASCATCPAAVIELRVRGSEVRETSYCGACSCPKWRLSRNAVRNWRSRWACPLKRHAGSDPNAMYHGYLRAKNEQAAAGGTGSDPSVAGGES